MTALGVLSHACNLRVQEGEAEESGVHCYPRLHKFEAGLVVLKTCFKKQKLLVKPELGS